MKVKIDLSRVPSINEQGEVRILPPNYEWRGEALLVTRLDSTRAGNAAWWRVGEEARRALNDAPYRPVVRCITRSFTWHPPDAKDCPSPLAFYKKESPPTDAIIQGGSEVINWIARECSPVPDPAKELIKSLLIFVNRDFCFSQGNLRVYSLVDEEIPHLQEILSLLQVGSWNRRFLNHVIVNHDGVVWRVIEGRYWGVVKVKEWTYFLSPEHPSYPLHLSKSSRLSKSEGLWVFSHPVPTSRGVD